MSETYSYVRITRRILQKIASGEGATRAKGGSELAAAIIDRLTARLGRQLLLFPDAVPEADLGQPDGGTPSRPTPSACN